MQTEQLFHTVLVDPALRGADQLRILSGYASPECGRHHLTVLASLGLTVDICLIVGMSGETGVDVNVHSEWLEVIDEFAGSASFELRYLPRGTSDHSKTYVWLKDGQAFAAWTGSANYSGKGFGLHGETRVETLTSVSPTDALGALDKAFARSVSARDAERDALVDFFRVAHVEVREPASPRTETVIVGPSLPRVSLPLVQARNGEVHNAGAGLNWGHRGSRNRAEAYIPVPRDVQESGFFPPPGVPFTVRTSDGHEMTVVRAQQNGKALETTHDNSIIGRYLREKLGLDHDAFVTTADLERFGSKHVDFTRLPDETYVLEFEPGELHRTPGGTTAMPPFLDGLTDDHRDRLLWFHGHAGRDFTDWPAGRDGELVAARPKGIYKPEGWEHALSVRIVPDTPYNDGRILRREDGTWVLHYHQEGDDPARRDHTRANVALMKCVYDHVPVGVVEELLSQARQRKTYRIHGLALPVDWSEGFFILEGFGAHGPHVERDSLAEIVDAFGPLAPGPRTS